MSSIFAAARDSQPWTTHTANLTLHAVLSTPTPTRPAIPNEIILQILDHPTRWIQVHNIALHTAAQEPLRCSSQGEHGGDWQVLATNPISADWVGKLRSVVYRFTSQDQGWSSYREHYGTYENSWTWFEAGLTLFDGPSVQGEELLRQQEAKAEKERVRYELHRNRHAGSEPEEYSVALERGHEMFERVEEGDRFALWARACFPGWANRIHEASIEIWCVDDLTDG